MLAPRMHVVHRRPVHAQSEALTVKGTFESPSWWVAHPHPGCESESVRGPLPIVVPVGAHRLWRRPAAYGLRFAAGSWHAHTRLLRHIPLCE